ncbi:MAG: anti-sigma factor [Chloroflexi bacterium]|nr:anti-sigma factor [Chloroflexota bacterium]
MAGPHVADDLAAYALGALDPEDRARVEGHLAGCTVCRDELARYSAVAAALREDSSEAAPPELVWERIAAHIRAGTPSPAAAAARAESRKLRLLGIGWAATAAALVAVVAIAGWREFRSSDTSVADLASRSELVVPLAGAPGYGSAPTGRLYVSEDRQQGGLAVTGMPVLNGDWTYQVWFVRRDQTRASGGTFDVNGKGEALVKVAIPGPLSQFEGVGITREPAGGSSTTWGADILSGPLYER